MILIIYVYSHPSIHHTKINKNHNDDDNYFNDSRNCIWTNAILTSPYFIPSKSIYIMFPLRRKQTMDNPINPITSWGKPWCFSIISMDTNFVFYFIPFVGFLLDFISLPVITGFTSAAAINIASSQFKSLLGIPGRSEDLVDTLKSIFKNSKQINLWDILLGTTTLFGLVLLKVHI